MTEDEKRVEKISSELRKLCFIGGREKDVSKTAAVIHQLGLAYHKLAERSKDLYEKQTSLIRSAVLFKAACARKPENTAEIDSDFSNLCLNVFTMAETAKQISDLGEHIELFKKQAGEMRQYAREEMKTMNKELTAQKRVQRVETIQKKITEKYTAIMRDLMQYCVKIKGEPPCRYALVGMGSLAREEITPYSDFEHIYLLDDSSVESGEDQQKVLDYFRWVAVIFQLIIIGLGETIIPSVYLPYLNNQSDFSFYDAYTPRGISFDGMMPHACKFPLGRAETQDKPWKTELIQPVAAMLTFLNRECDIKNGYHLSDILAKTCFVEGDRAIFDDFKNRSLTLLQRESDDIARKLIVDQIQDDLTKWKTDFEQTQYSTRHVDIKKVVYRSVTLPISALGRIHVPKINSSLGIIRELAKLDYFDGEFRDRLLFAVTLACEVRLNLYLENDRQVDLHSASNENDGVLLRSLGEENAVDCLRTIFDLQIFLKKKFGVQLDDMVRSYEVLGDIAIFYSLQMYQKSLDVCHKMMLGLSNSKRSQKKFECCWFIAYNYFSQVKFAKALAVIEDNKLAQNAHKLVEPEFCWAVYTVGLLLVQDYGEKALAYYNKVVKRYAKNNSVPKSKLWYWFLFEGICQLSNTNYDGAISCLKRSEQFSDKYYKPELIGLVGVNLESREFYQEAADNLNKAYFLQRCLTQDKIVDLRTVFYLSHMALCNTKLNNNKGAMLQMGLCCDLLNSPVITNKYKALLQLAEEESEPTILEDVSFEVKSINKWVGILNLSRSHFNIGICRTNLNKFDEAVMNFEISAVGFAVTGRYKELAVAFSQLSFCTYMQNDYNLAIAYHIRELRYCEKLFKEKLMDKTNDTTYGYCLHSLATMYKRQDKKNAAYTYYERAAKALNLVKDYSSIWCADCYENCAVQKLELADFRSALGLFRKEMRVSPTPFDKLATCQNQITRCRQEIKLRRGARLRRWCCATSQE